MSLADDLLELLREQEWTVGEGFNGGTDGDTAAMRRAAASGIPLADFEDDQGRLPHDEETRMTPKQRMARTKWTTCRVCGNVASRYGRYAGLCENHRHEGSDNGMSEEHGMTEEQAAEASAPHGNVAVVPPSERIVVGPVERELLGETFPDAMVPNPELEHGAPDAEIIQAAVDVAEAKRAVEAAEATLDNRVWRLRELLQSAIDAQVTT